MTDNIRFKDFSSSPEPIHFRIAPDDFRCYPEIPLDTMLEVTELAGNKELTGMARFKEFLEILTGVIVVDDYDKFIERTRKPTKDKPNPNPIGLKHMQDIIPWIMEVYGLRPTRESSESADGSAPDDTSLTEPAFVEVSTS